MERTLPSKSESNVGLVELRRRAEPRTSGVVHQDVDLARFLGQTAHLGEVGQVGGHEPSAASLRFDLV